MKKLLSISTAILLFSFSSKAQSKPLKLVFDFVKPDTTDFRFMMLQINNVLLEAPYTKITVVCSSKGLNMLVSDKTNVQPEIAALQKAFNVSFAACANSMRRLKVEKSQLVPQANIVPVALLEIAAKEQEGWSYIKAGN